MIESITKETALGTRVTLEYDKDDIAIMLDRSNPMRPYVRLSVTADTLEYGRYTGEMTPPHDIEGGPAAEWESTIEWETAAPDDWEDIEDTAKSLLEDILQTKVVININPPPVPENILLSVKIVYRVMVAFGEENSEDLIQGRKLPETAIVKTYEFDSAEEAEAFKKGIEEGVGWHGHYIVSPEEKHLLPEFIQEALRE